MVAVSAALILLAGAPAVADGDYRVDVDEQLHPGVVWSQLRTGDPLTIDLAKVHPDAPVRLVPVISDGHLLDDPPGRRHAPVTSMCAAVGGVVCVNGDFWVCPNCGPPGGGVVVDGVPLRTPTVLHPQVSVLDDGRLVADELRIDVRLEAVFEPEQEGLIDDVVGEPRPPRTETLTIQEINRPMADGVVLYSPTWAGSTQQGAETSEAVLGGPVPAIGAAADAVVRDVGGGHDRGIPDGGFVLVATGSARDGFADRLDAMRDADRLSLRVDANLPVQMSTGGHPVILRDGVPVPLDQADPKVSNRHPRTILGWNDAREIWLLTIDGRQRDHSVGVTLHEAADRLRRLGATDAMNLDGGGSSTFVTAAACPDGTRPCVRNRPSDGRERHLATALALVPTDDTPVALGAVPVPPPPPPTTVPVRTSAPRPTPPSAAPLAVTTTTAPPSTTATPTTTITTSAPPTAPATRPRPTTASLRIDVEDNRRDRRGPVAVAASALFVVGVLTTREWQRTDSGGPLLRRRITGR